MSSVVWVWPILFLARASTARLPRAAGVKLKLKVRNAKRPRSSPKVAADQLLPPSLDTSTLLTPQPPSRAVPPPATGRPAGTRAPWPWLVISELTTISVIGVLTAVSCDTKRATTGKRPSGTRYAAAIQKPDCGLVSAAIEVTC